LFLFITRTIIIGARGVSAMYIHYEQPKKVGIGLGLAILLVPFLAVWALLQDGYSSTTRVIGFGWLAFFLIIAFHTMQDPAGSDNDKPQVAPAAADVPTTNKWPRVSFSAP
jgi:hypothetical protein